MGQGSWRVIGGVSLRFDNAIPRLPVPQAAAVKAEKKAAAKAEKKAAAAAAKAEATVAAKASKAEKKEVKAQASVEVAAVTGELLDLFTEASGDLP